MTDTIKTSYNCTFIVYELSYRTDYTHQPDAKSEMEGIRSQKKLDLRTEKLQVLIANVYNFCEILTLDK